jgi:hypothetical protein
MAALVVVAAACSGGAAAPTIEAVPKATALQPTTNGFAFANFPAAMVPEELDGNDLLTMFGSAACQDGVADPCTPTAEAAVWAQMVNQARGAGHCAGMVVQAAQRFRLDELPATVDLVNTGDVTHGIIRAFATQFLPEPQQEADAWAKRSMREIVAELATSFGSPKPTWTLGLYTDVGGHAVLPYAVEYPDADTAVVQVYDSNWPGRNRYVEFDLAADTWTFSFSGDDPATDPAPWTGGKGDADLTALDTRVAATCPFCGTTSNVQSSMLVIRATDPNWTVETQNGTFSPLADAPVEGVIARPIQSGAAGSGPQTYDYVVLVNGTRFTLNLPDPTSAFIIKPDSISRVLTSGGGPSPIVVGDGTISVADPETSLTVASNDLVLQTSGTSATVNVGATQLDVVVKTPEGEQFSFTVFGEAPEALIQFAVDDIGPVLVVVTDFVAEPTTIREIRPDGSETVTTTEEPLELTKVAPDLPDELRPDDVKPGLPPVAQRDLANPDYRVDAAYVPPADAVTATTAPGDSGSSAVAAGTTTTAPAAPSAGTSTSTTAAATTPTTRPPTRTTLAPSSTSSSSTSSSSTTAAPPPPPAPTTSSTTTTTAPSCTPPPVTVPPGPHLYAATGLNYWVYLNGDCYGNAPPVPPPGPITGTGTFTKVDEDWGAGGPPGSGTGDYYMIEYKGYMWPPKAAQYWFCAYTDDGHKVSIAGTLLGDIWTDRFAHCGSTFSYTFDGSAKTFDMWYYEHDASASSRLRYNVMDAGDPNGWDAVPESWFSNLMQPSTPSAPTNLYLEPVDGGMNLSWSLPLSTGGSPITDYQAFYATNIAGPWEVFADPVSTVKEIAVTGLTNSTNHWFKVVAKNSDGYGDLSAISSAIAPVAYAAAPANLVLSGKTNTTLTFSWDPLVHSGDNYRMFWSQNADVSFPTYTGTGGTSYTITGLTPSTTYYFRLAGWRNGVPADVLQYRTSQWSVIVSATTNP